MSRVSLVVLSLLSCGALPSGPADAGVPMNALDAGLPDAAIDAGSTDAGPVDAGAFDAGTADAGPVELIFLMPSTQRPGDPDAGYHRLVNDPYVNCGIPSLIYQALAGAPPPEKQLPGRTGTNVNVAFNYTASIGKTGAEVVGPNCFTCHAEMMQGHLMVGLGNTTKDFTTDDSATIAAMAQFLTDPKDKAEHAKFSGRTSIIGPLIHTKTRGTNPADTLAAVIFAHRDQNTLVWSDTPLLPEPTQVLPVDVPPWWRMKKKNVMFATGSGRGDHARMMMSASSLCIDGVADAQAIDTTFNDVRAYLASLTPPPYPLAINATLAAQGETVFMATCARCHGTKTQYPNLLVSLPFIGTDPALARSATESQRRYENWFNGSFWGQTAHLESLEGYVAPPLDGIWATAPYLHNGSVPTLEGVLNSTARPRFWQRTFDANEYDVSTMSLRFTALSTGHSTAADATIYDTTELGYGNGGHLYGDSLTAPERTAVLEYLKTW